MTGSTWATKYLEVFHCRIWAPTVNFSLQSYHTIRKPRPLIETCRNIHRKTYQHLARQTQLRSPCLSDEVGGIGSHYGADDFCSRYYCVEMSLLSGLNELEDLKKMEKLDVHCMDHNVGIKELGWMSENWPRMKYIHGIVHQWPQNFRGSAMENWLMTHRPSWESN